MPFLPPRPSIWGRSEDGKLCQGPSACCGYSKRRRAAGSPAHRCRRRRSGRRGRSRWRARRIASKRGHGGQRRSCGLLATVGREAGEAGTRGSDFRTRSSDRSRGRRAALEPPEHPHRLGLILGPVEHYGGEPDESLHGAQPITALAHRPPLTSATVRRLARPAERRLTPFHGCAPASPGEGCGRPQARAARVPASDIAT